MTYEYKEVQTCTEHGFALSPEGACTRCRTLAARAKVRAEVARVVAGGVFVMALLGGTAAWAKARSSPPVASSPARREIMLAPSMPSARSTVAAEVFPEVDRPHRVTSPATHAALRAWERELARADGKRFAELEAEAQARQSSSMPAVVAAPRGGKPRPVVHTAPEPRPQVSQAARVELPAGNEDHPSWWTDPPLPRRSRSCGRALRPAVANPAPRTDGVWTPTNSTP